MSKVKISKAEAALWGIEHIGKWKKKQSHLVGASKEQAAKAGHAVAETLKISNSDWKREVLEGRKRSTNNDNQTSPDISKDGPESIVEKDIPEPMNAANKEQQQVNLNPESHSPSGRTFTAQPQAISARQVNETT
ncbi:hypothetical protein BDP27DRAFT_1314034 [Rhodocollybia butyracea]|uniref:Uncharacterized protein n=1 Tax=Rhodocollybia butyracea TaxID=206335 RepID=A0A9P5UEF8_9AGAR|nr:hypothetical protein BDP27DRAFT_1314034 [Rhodocollybia butyracea]